MKTIVQEPNLYDLLYQDVTEDINLYLTVTKPYNDILEFGAGTGRVTIPLAYDNHHVVAVDIEQAMLDKFEEKIEKDPFLRDKIQLVNGNMCSYRNPKKFDCIIIPLTSFNYLLTETEQLDCLKTVRENLTEDGIAVIELLSDKTFKDTNTSDEPKYVETLRLSDTSYYEYWRTTKLDLKNRKISQERIFKLFENGIQTDEKKLIWNNRFVTLEDFKRLVEMENLYIEEIYGNCQLEKYTENSEDVFVKVRRVSNRSK